MKARKFLSVLLSVMLVFSFMNINVMAETTETTTTVSVTALNGDGTSESPYLIGTLDELKWFRDNVNSGNNYSGKYVQLTASIDLNNEQWTPIGTETNPFKGIFDGNSQTVTNLIVKGSENQGFFGYVTETTIKNLKIQNIDVTGTNCVGGIAGCGYASTYIDNCHVSGSIKIYGLTNIGGITGKYYARVTNSSVVGDDPSTSYVKGVYQEADLEGDNVGGIMGHAGENNTHSGNIVKNITVSGTRKIGGLIGTTDRQTDLSNCTVENVIIESTATADYASSNSATTTLGGLIGNYYGNATGGTITGCAVNSATFNAGYATNVGAFVGGVRVAPDATEVTGVTASGNTASIITGATNDFFEEAIAKVGDTEYTSLIDAAAAAQSGDTITMLADTTITSNLTLPAGITFNGNGKKISRSGDVSVKAGGDLTFEGYSIIANFNASGKTITIGKGATLETTDGRMVIGNGATFNITGSVTDAKTADTSNITPSLIAPGSSFTGADVTFNVTDAYIKFTAYSSSKNKSANGTFNLNVTNSVWEQTGKLAFESPTNNMDPTVNFNLKDSVLNTTSHLVFAVTKGEIVIDNSNVNKNKATQLENRSTMIIKNGSVVYGTDATSSNATKPGTLTVDNATYVGTGEFSGSTLGTGKLVLKNNASVSLGSISKTNITVDGTILLTATNIKDTTTTTVTVDAASMTAGTTKKVIDLSGNASIQDIVTVSENAEVTYGNDGDVTVTKKAVPVAKVNDTEYTDLATAISNAANGDTVEILAAGTYSVPTGKNITITGAVDGVIFDMSNAVGVYASMTFNNVTFEYSNNNYIGLQHAGDMVYNNCTFNGQLFLYGTSETFNICTFNQTSSDAYNVWTYGAKEVTFNECTFNSAGKSVLIYSEQSDLVNNVTVTKTTFNASAVVDGKAAIEMDSSLTAGINLTIDSETTATGFSSDTVSGSTLWNNKKGSEDVNNDITVIVNNITLLEPTTPDLPTASVSDITEDETTPDLTFALNFKADEVTDEQLDYYEKWYADFVLTVNKDVTFNANGTADGYLSGQYDTWSENWVNVPFDDVTLKAGESFKIMEYAADYLGQTGLKITYNDVYSAVKDFDCGVFLSDEFLAANPDFEVTLELRMYNPDDETESYAIGETYEFTAAEVVGTLDTINFAIYNVIEKVNDVDYIAVTFFAGLDGIKNYKRAGFIINAGGNEVEIDTDTAYKTIKANDANGIAQTYKPSDFGDSCQYIYGQKIWFPMEYDGLPIRWKPFAETLEGKILYGYTSELPDAYITTTD